MLAGAVRQLPSAASASASPNLARYADRSCRKLALGNLAAFVIIGVWTQRDPAGVREIGHRLNVAIECRAVEYQRRGCQIAAIHGERRGHVIRLRSGARWWP